MKRALETLGTVAVLVGAVGLLAVCLRATPTVDASLSARDRSDWWKAYIAGGWRR